MIRVLKELSDNDQIVLDVMMDSEPYRVIIYADAIPNRMAMYNLATADEAKDAILREHYTRKKKPPVAFTQSWRAMTIAQQRQMNGGLDDTIRIQRTT